MGDCASCAGRQVECRPVQPARALPHRLERSQKRQRSGNSSPRFFVHYPVEQEFAASVLHAQSHDHNSQSDPLSPQGQLHYGNVSLATAAHRLSLALTLECGEDSDWGDNSQGHPHRKHLAALAGVQPEYHTPWSEKVCEADTCTQCLKASSQELDQHYDSIKPRLNELKVLFARERPEEVLPHARVYRARVMRDMDPDARMHWMLRDQNFAAPLVCADVAQQLDKQKAGGDGAVVAVSAVLRE